jgi:hypothetical protein
MLKMFARQKFIGKFMEKMLWVMNGEKMV